jgi:hypothetical protein
MIQAFRGRDSGKSTEAGKLVGNGPERVSGNSIDVGLRRRAILSGLPGSGHPLARRPDLWEALQ